MLYVQGLLSQFEKFITHWRIFHSFTENNDYICTVPDCKRKLSNLNSFKRHFKLNHSDYFDSCNLNSTNNNTQGLIQSSNKVSNISKGKDSEVENLNTSSSIILNDPDELLGLASPSTSGNTDKDTFYNIIEFQMQQMITNLYSNPSVPRKFVQLVIDEMQHMIGVPIKLLQDKVKEIFVAHLVPLEKQIEVNSMFEGFGLVHENNKTEYLRFKNLREGGLLIDPFSTKIGEDFESKNEGEIPKNRLAQIVPLRIVLKAYLESGDILDCILEYVASLQTSNSTVISNIMEGEAWTKNTSNREGKIYLPASMFFDAYETGNCLGSHSGVHSLGGAYVSLKCIPRQYRSQSANMFLAMLVHDADHKKFGNGVIFSKLIAEFNHLASEGILIETKTKKLRVFIILAALEGDNVGLNLILGYSRSFSANYYCRICKMSKVECQYATIAKKSTLRTEANYETDVAENDFVSSGIREESVFNKVHFFHCTRNLVADIMHDLAEGILPLETGLVSHQIILVEKLIDFDVFNSILHNFNFQFESSTPTGVTLDQLKSKFMKMSATEMFTFCTYAPIMYGRFVPRNNIYW